MVMRLLEQCHLAHLFSVIICAEGPRPSSSPAQPQPPLSESRSAPPFMAAVLRPSQTHRVCFVLLFSAFLYRVHAALGGCGVLYGRGTAHGRGGAFAGTCHLWRRAIYGGG
eukprot:1387836-Rhodomonas_salina.1